MKKKMYEKPLIEVVEIQLSDCIAGSAGGGLPGASSKGQYNFYIRDERTGTRSGNWSSWTGE